MASADGQPIWLSVDGEVVTAESGVRQGKHERGLVHGLDVGRAISRGHARDYGSFTWVPGSRSRSGERIVTASPMCGGTATRQGLAVRPVQVPEDDCEPCRLPGRQLARLAMTDLPLPRRGGTGPRSAPPGGAGIPRRAHHLQAVPPPGSTAPERPARLPATPGRAPAGKAPPPP